MAVDQTILFRCVCGASIGLDDGSTGQCQSCGRKISGQVSGCNATIALGNYAEPDDLCDDVVLGKTIDHFTIMNRLGAGGMGTVYRALDESLQRYVALKVIRPKHIADLSGTPEMQHVTSLLEEARAQARVSHSNVVHVYYVSRDPQKPYLAMELLPDGTIADALNKGKMAYCDVVRTGMQVAEALREAAKLDIVHGDIKPSNILLSKSTAKLSDFGLAQRIASNGSSERRLSGTPNYMAPEIFDGERVTVQSDMYAYGVMLFEMTFGRLPFTFSDSSILSRLEAHQKHSIEFPEPWPDDVPAGWRNFLARLLAKDPTQRFGQWSSLIHSLSELRPIQPVLAGRLKRGIAWSIDLLVQLLAMVALQRILDLALPETKFFSWILLLSGLIIPALMMLWISRGRSTPGKALMQLRIVDRYGLTKSPRALALRSMLPFLPLWLLPTAERNELVALPRQLWVPLWIGMAAFLFLDALAALFLPSRRSIHDELFDTRVVLDEAQRTKV